MINDIRELFLEIGGNYISASNESFANHELASLIRRKPNEIFSKLMEGPELIVKSSAGQAQWADVPWIAIINKTESDGAKEGIYIVYLFSRDMKRLYLCLGQGITRPIEKGGRKIAFKKLEAKAIDIRSNYSLEDFVADNKLDLAKSGLGSDYEKAVIFYKEYKIANLPSNDILESDLKRLMSFYNRYLLEANILTEGTDFSECEGEVEEGKKVLKRHYVRERNPKVIKEAKRTALGQTGELRCEVCGFSFFDKYGERGKDFIEGHHKKPIAAMKEGEITSPEDIALICSNCHRMIHKKQPWLSIQELKKISNRTM